MKELLTLSAFIDKVYGWGSNVTYSGCYHSIKEYNNFLKGTVQLYHFIPCKDGKPLEKLSNYKECGIQTQIACSQELEPCECMALSNYKKAYQQAQDAVIFEGWEVVESNSNAVIITNGYYSILSLSKSIRIKTSDIKNSGESITTYSDLAEATQGNPLKMRK